MPVQFSAGPSHPALALLRACIAALLLLCAATLGWAAPAAHAAVQTVEDPDDPFEETEDGQAFGHSADFRALTLDTTSTPGTLRVKVDLDRAAGAGIGGVIYFDTGDDNRADYAIELRGGDADPGRHPDLAGAGGRVYWKLRQVPSSTQTCQVYDEGDDFFATYDEQPATATLSPSRTTFELAIPRASLGNPQTVRWAAIGINQRAWFRPYDLMPDAANGAHDPRSDDNALADPRNPPPLEQDVWYCAPEASNLPASGYAVNLAYATRFALDAAVTPPPPVDLAPTVTVTQNPALPRHGRPVTFTARAQDDGRVTSILWDLNDDGTFNDASGDTATRTFDQNGTYTIAVRVTDDGNHVTTQRHTVVVADRPPSLTLSASTMRPGAREKFTVTANVASDGSIDAAKVEWGFDADNNGDDSENEPYTYARGSSWTLSFGVPGTYTIKARITDDEGRTARGRVTVVVPNQPPVFRELRYRAKKTPDEPFNRDPIVKGKPIVLQAVLSDDNLQRPRVDWDLDGNGIYDDATGEQIEHTFADAGQKTVGVRITDEYGEIALGSGAFEVLESAEAGCTGKTGTDMVRIQGCFETVYPKTPTGAPIKDAAGKQVAAKGTYNPFKLNGLVFVPQDGAGVYFQAGGVLSVFGRGTVKVMAGTTVLFDGRFELEPNCDPAKRECLLGKWASPALSTLKGLPLKGDVEVYLTPDGTRVKVNVDVFGTLGLGVTARADLITGDKIGLKLNSLEVRSPMIPIGKLTIGQFFIVYDAGTGLWEGGGEVTLPTPQFTKLIGDFAFNERTGILERAHGEVDGLNIPIDAFASVYLQRVAFTIEIKGMGTSNPRVRLGGGLGISAGPRIGGLDIATVDGDFLATFGNPFGLDVEGRISLAGFDVMGGTAGFRTNGHAYLQGFVGFGLPFPHAFKGKRQDATKAKVTRFASNGSDVFNPLTQIVSVKGEAEAWVEPDGFNLEAAIYAKVLGITLAKAQGLMSHVGIAGCGEIIGIGGGFGYDFRTDKVTTFGDGCDLGPWRAKPKLAPADGYGAGRVPGAKAGLATRAQATEDAMGVEVARNQKALVLKLNGATGDPVVALISPSGRRYAAPGGEPAFQSEDFFVAQHTLAANETYLGVREPEPGRWTIERAPGSSAISEIAGADVLPDPKVSGSVTASGASRTLRYRVKAIPGQTVVFAEKGDGAYRTIGKARGTRGTIRFTPTRGRAGTRKIIAIVRQGEFDRKHLRIASFRAAAPRAPRVPRGLRVTRERDGRALLTWRSVRGASGYRVVARKAGGETLFTQTKNTHWAISSTRNTSIRFEMRAVDATGRASAPAKVRLPRRTAARAQARGARLALLDRLTQPPAPVAGRTA